MGKNVTAYTKLETIFNRWNALNNAASILHWDNATMMPSGSGDTRGEQLTVPLPSFLMEIITSSPASLVIYLPMRKPKLPRLVTGSRPNFGEMKRIWCHATALPTELVSALTKSLP